jgi:hypothetical protein
MVIATWNGQSARGTFYIVPSDVEETESLMQEIYGRSPTLEEYVRAFRRYGGNETEFLCYDCLAISRIDVEIDLRICASCQSVALRAASRLAKTRCPKCDERHFNDGEITAIS